MNKSSLILIFKTLNNNELLKFRLYLESPYFSKGKYKKETIKLFDFIVDQIRSENISNFDKEIAFVHVFPGHVFSESKIDQAMSELNKMLKSFLLTERYFQEEKEIIQQTDFAYVLRERGLTQKSFNLANSIVNRIEASKVRKEDDYEAMLKASKLISLIESLLSTLRNDHNISNSIAALNQYYLHSKLILLNALLLLTKQAKIAHNIDFEVERDHILKLMPDAKGNAEIYLSHLIFSLYTKQTIHISDFEYFLSEIKKNEGKVEEKSIKNIYALARSYCTFLFMEGNSHLASVLHELQVDNLQKGHFYHLGRIMPAAFFSIIHIGLKMQNISWVMNFIEEHEDKIIGETETKDYYRFGLFIFYIETKEYEKALDVIPINIQHVELLLNVKALEIKALFELRSNLFEFKIDAFKVYISRSSKNILSENTHERYSNFINFLYQISNSKPGKKRRGETIINRINEKKLVVHRDWLIEKAKQLK